MFRESGDGDQRHHQAVDEPVGYQIEGGEDDHESERLDHEIGVFIQGEREEEQQHAEDLGERDADLIYAEGPHGVDARAGQDDEYEKNNTAEKQNEKGLLRFQNEPVRDCERKIEDAEDGKHPLQVSGQMVDLVLEKAAFGFRMRKFTGGERQGPVGRFVLLYGHGQKPHFSAGWGIGNQSGTNSLLATCSTNS